MSDGFQFAIDFSGERPVRVQERIADGMQQADDNANERWKHIFDACVLLAAKSKPEITSDDVLAEIEKLPKMPHTHNLSAIGPAMKRGFDMGILLPTTKVVRSERPEKKGNYHRVWRSLQFAGEGKQ